MPRQIRFLSLACALPAIALLAACATTPMEQARIEDQRRAEAVSTAARARKAQDAGKLDQAIELYGDAIQLAPDIPGFRTNMGVALMAKGERIAASDAFKTETVLFPTACQQALTNLGMLYAETGWNNDAYDYFTRATQLAPYEPMALRGVITTGFLQENPDYDQLKVYLERALLVEKDPKLRDDFQWKQVRADNAKRQKATGPGRYETPGKVGKPPKGAPTAAPADKNAPPPAPSAAREEPAQPPKP